MRLAGWVVLVSLSVGCDGGDSAAFGGGDGGIGEDSFQDDDPPMGDCDDTGCGGAGVGDDGAGSGGGAQGAPVGSPCDGTNQCQSGVCAATFDGDDAGALECQDACIDAIDQAMWCSDSGSCCAGLVCTSRGLCVPDESGEESEGDGDAGTTGGSDDGSNDSSDGSAAGSTGGTSGGATSDSGESTN